MNHKFGIEEDGNVYRYDNRWDGWRLLGRLPCVLGEPTPIGREVRAWWKALVESNEPLEFLEDERRTAVPVAGSGRFLWLCLSTWAHALDELAFFAHNDFYVSDCRRTKDESGKMS